MIYFPLVPGIMSSLVHCLLLLSVLSSVIVLSSCLVVYVIVLLSPDVCHVFLCFEVRYAVTLVYVSVLCLETQKKISWSMWKPNIWWWPLIVFFHTKDVNGYCQRFSFQHSSKYLLLCSTDKRKIQVWNNLRPMKWQKFHFWVNYPFKLMCFWIIVDLSLHPRLAQASNITLQHLKETKRTCFHEIHPTTSLKWRFEITISIFSLEDLNRAYAEDI